MLGIRTLFRGAPAPWWSDADSLLAFEFAGRKFRAFVGAHNCGWPPHRMTERAVELALADKWLEGVDRDLLLEIGAVTPYYWPHRVANVVDPQDTHPLVTIRKSLFDLDLRGKPVLSISTLEHIGLAQYGLAERRTAMEAMDKLFSESPQFLVTCPHGYNPELDAYLARGVPDGTERRYLVRSRSGNEWRETTGAAELPPYGSGEMPHGSAPPSSQAWANALVVLTRGPFPDQPKIR